MVAEDGGGAGASVDDSEIVITKRLSGPGSSVRIRIGGSARSPTENIEKVTDNWPESRLSESGPGLRETGSGPELPGKIQRNNELQRFGECRWLVCAVCTELGELPVVRDARPQIVSLL